MIGIGFVLFGRFKQGKVEFGCVRLDGVGLGSVWFGFGLGWIVLVNFTGVFPEDLNDLGICFIQGWGWVGVGEMG